MRIMKVTKVPRIGSATDGIIEELLANDPPASPFLSYFRRSGMACILYLHIQNKGEGMRRRYTM